MDPRSPSPVGSDWRESFEPRLCRWGGRKPRQSVEQCADIPRWDCAASFGPRLHGVLCWVLLGRAYSCAGRRRAGDTCGSLEPGGGSRGSKVSERWLNGSGGRGEGGEHTHRRRGDLKCVDGVTAAANRSEERRVGKECRS